MDANLPARGAAVIPASLMGHAATAYVAWLAAAMAGVILGRETAAKPPRLPSTVPWRAPSQPTI